ncbi:queuosine precursor transporter [Pelagerythrobacter rhizovicinus]|uniref:Probable queuosine precursor transporter n=1 Tax=Pelagerythrobacter rhizovicinus TaxID=2268576 RepID=A0A4V1QVX9_9SPHN|nr:queuosine precursor transporter [Pelagerythrobacter rhizovicinus]RXZ64216.1 VUT family protein [Pelagerythrobacter rhizovicinus]
MNDASAANPIPQSLFVFALIYGGMTVLAGFLAVKQVMLWPTSLGVEAGIFAFLILVVLSSATAQMHGPAVANRLVVWGFLPLAMSIVLILLVLRLPADPAMWPEGLEAFQLIHATTPRIMAAGPVAYLVSLLLNVWIFSKLRGEGDAKGNVGLMVRGAIASALSQAIDSVIFITLAFGGEREIGSLIAGQALAKIVLSLVLVPFLIAIAVKIAQRLDRGQAG